MLVPSQYDEFLSMPEPELLAKPLDQLIDQCIADARTQTGLPQMPGIVVSPYRFNPLGAHIDHQGGSVLARCLDQYTILCFWPSEDKSCSLSCQLGGSWQTVKLNAGEQHDSFGWDSMFSASAAAFNAHTGMLRGIDAVVFGTLVSGGLSSSASVILAYLSAFASVNDVRLDPVDLVELCRQVENDYRGLNNGIQDQMSIAFGRKNHLACLHMNTVTADMIADPSGVDSVCFLMCYSGVSRNLTGSGFNTRVAECREAARSLCPDARHLGEVPVALRSERDLSALPDLLQRRARHVYSEIARVAEGLDAWNQGNWRRFGQLMDASCRSSIDDYESGSEWLIALHEIGTTIDGVYGNRFSGGGYGGCLFLLVEASEVTDIARQLMQQYLARYPEMTGHARLSIAQSEGTVRVFQA